jgi:hypothetical protein
MVGILNIRAADDEVGVDQTEKLGLLPAAYQH